MFVCLKMPGKSAFQRSMYGTPRQACPLLHSYSFPPSPQVKIYFALMHLHPLDVRITYRGTPGSDVQDAEELTLSTMAQLNDARCLSTAARLVFFVCFFSQCIYTYVSFVLFVFPFILFFEPAVAAELCLVFHVRVTSRCVLFFYLFWGGLPRYLILNAGEIFLVRTCSWGPCRERRGVCAKSKYTQRAAASAVVPPPPTTTTLETPRTKK